MHAEFSHKPESAAGAMNTINEMVAECAVNVWRMIRSGLHGSIEHGLLPCLHGFCLLATGRLVLWFVSHVSHIALCKVDSRNPKGSLGYTENIQTSATAMSGSRRVRTASRYHRRSAT